MNSSPHEWVRVIQHLIVEFHIIIELSWDQLKLYLQSNKYVDLVKRCFHLNRGTLRAYYNHRTYSDLHTHSK